MKPSASNHLLSMGKALTLLLLLLGSVAWAGFLALRPVIGHSNFRLALAADAQRRFAGRTVTLIVGDSRLMDGVNAAQVNAENPKELVFNAAFNGLEFRDVRAVVTAFAGSCKCRLKRVVVDETALEDLTPGVSDVRIFLSGFNRDVQETIKSDDAVRYWGVRAFPLVHFDNELTHRSLYYLLQGGDDQGHGNDYHFRVSNSVIHGLVKSEKTSTIDAAMVSAFVRDLHERGTHLAVVVVPQHGVYVRNRRGYSRYRADVGSLVNAAGAEYYDHAALFEDQPDFFADLIHLNLDGQRMYSRYLARTVINTP